MKPKNYYIVRQQLKEAPTSELIDLYEIILGHLPPDLTRQEIISVLMHNYWTEVETAMIIPKKEIR